MPNYGFLPSFGAQIKAGLKTTSIRKTDKAARPGDIAKFYTTECHERIGFFQITSIKKIKLMLESGQKPVAIVNDPQKFTVIEGDSLDQLSVREGFANANSMFNFYHVSKTKPFVGYLHTWQFAQPKNARRV